MLVAMLSMMVMTQMPNGERFGIGLDLSLGGAVYKRPDVSPQRFDLGVRAHFEGRVGKVLLGGFAQLAATVGEDLRLGVGPVLRVELPRDFALLLSPGFYGRNTTSWEPGVNAGVVAFWYSLIGLGVETRFGLGPTHERAIVASPYRSPTEVLSDLGVWKS
jgi:hypothetical protein